MIWRKEFAFIVFFVLLSFSSVIRVGASSGMWIQTYGGASFDGASTLIVTSEGGFALAGSTDSFGSGDADFWLVKTDGSGNVEWNQTYGGTSFDGAYALVETSDGGFALTGETASFGAGDVDFWLVKTDENGIIPEFPSWIIPPLILSLTLVITFFRRILAGHLNSGNYLKACE